MRSLWCPRVARHIDVAASDDIGCLIRSPRFSSGSGSCGAIRRKSRAERSASSPRRTGGKGPSRRLSVPVPGAGGKCRRVTGHAVLTARATSAMPLFRSPSVTRAGSPAVSERCQSAEQDTVTPRANVRNSALNLGIALAPRPQEQVRLHDPRLLSSFRIGEGSDSWRSLQVLSQVRRGLNGTVPVAQERTARVISILRPKPLAMDAS